MITVITVICMIAMIVMIAMIAMTAMIAMITMADQGEELVDRHKDCDRHDHLSSAKSAVALAAMSHSILLLKIRNQKNSQ